MAGGCWTFDVHHLLHVVDRVDLLVPFFLSITRHFDAVIFQYPSVTVLQPLYGASGLKGI